MNETLATALAKLRFAEPLRRNADAARAEANLHLAQGLTEIEGVPGALGNLRKRSLTPTQPARELSVEETVARNYWQMQLWVSQQWPELNPRPARKTGGILQVCSTPTTPAPTPTRSGLATLHKLASRGLATPAKTSAQVSIPNAEASQLCAQILETNNLPMLERASLAVAQNLLTPLFEVHAQPVLLTWVRHLLVTHGVEPTGTLLLTHGWQTNQPKVRAWVQTAQTQGISAATLGAWQEIWEEILLESFAPTHALLRNVQAGVLPEKCDNTAE